MNPRLPLTAACLAAALTLGACSGGGGGSTDRVRSLSDSDDPNVARLGDLLERADALLMTGSYARWSLSAEGEATIEDAFVEAVTCAGARCVTADGTETTVGDLLDASASGIDADAAEATLGMRGGFDTVTTRGAFEVTETLPELSLTVSPEVTSWGFWGDHGFAALAIGEGPLAATIEGTSFSGTFSSAQAYVAGDATGTNPAGTGSATWTGIAEASPTGAPARLMGTATVTIADLSRPQVDVGIDLDEGGVDRALRWTDMPLADGGFSAGRAGTDYLRGNFHGPAHEEVWGVFDTTGYLGAFGAKRTP